MAAQHAVERQEQAQEWYRQLIVLGACLVSRKTLDSVEPSSFSDKHIAGVVRSIKSNDSAYAKLKQFLDRTIGVTYEGRAIDALVDQVRVDGTFRRLQTRLNESAGTLDKRSAIGVVGSMLAESATTAGAVTDD